MKRLELMRPRYAALRYGALAARRERHYARAPLRYASRATLLHMLRYYKVTLMSAD